MASYTLAAFGKDPAEGIFSPSPSFASTSALIAFPMAFASQLQGSSFTGVIWMTVIAARTSPPPPANNSKTLTFGEYGDTEWVDGWFSLKRNSEKNEECSE